MIAYQKDIWSPTVEGTREIVTKAESSKKTKELTEKSRQTGEAQPKRKLPAVCYMATFEESTNDKGITARWRKQEKALLTGEVVSDFDHLDENPGTLFVLWQAMLDFKQEGILKVFITPSGKGIKVVSKWRKEWGNLAENQLQIARMLDMERYLDVSGKDASRTAFVPMRSDVLYEDDEVYTYFDPECDKLLGEAYRSGESGTEKKTPESQQAPATPAVELTERQKAIVEALNGFYGKSLGEGQKHPTFCQQTSNWLLWLVDNNPQVAIAMAYQLDYVKDWQPQKGEVEDLINSAASKKLLKQTPKALKEIMDKAGIDSEKPVTASPDADPVAELPFDRWCDTIESLFDVYPCLREVCEPNPRRLWPFLLFASSAMMGTCMDLTYYYFYANKGERTRLNYIIWGVGDPTSGKHSVERLMNNLLAPIIAEGDVADDSTNTWKESTDAQGANREKDIRPAIYNRMFGYRTSNSEFIRSLINCKEEVDGEVMGRHMVTVSSEKDVEIGKAGSWISKSNMILLSFHGEYDDQHYSNKQSVSGRYRVFWNMVETFTPPTLAKLVNDRNVNSGLDTRTGTIPMGEEDFRMMPLGEKDDPKIAAFNDTLKSWAYKLDQRRGELPLWPLVEHVHKWCDERRDIAEFNDKDKADWLLIKRVPYYGINISAPYVDMRHWKEREETGTYVIDDTDRRLCSLVLDIQYRTQLYWFYELHRRYYDNQLRDAAQQRRRTNKFIECFRQLPEEFTTEGFAKTFGYANARSGQKTLERLLADKAIERTMRGNYKKLVSELPLI